MTAESAGAGSDDRVAAALANHVETWYRRAYRRDPTPRDRLSIDYYSKRTPNRVELLLGPLNQELCRHSPSRVLDVGCGYASIPLLLAGRWPTSVIDATDVTDQYFWVAQAAAKDLGIENITFRTVDVLNIDAADRYDLAVCCNMLNFMTSAEALDRACGVLLQAVRPGGYVAIHTSHYWSWREPFTNIPYLQLLSVGLQDKIARATGKRSLMTDIRHPSFGEIRRAFAHRGAQIVAWRPRRMPQRIWSAHINLWFRK